MPNWCYNEYKLEGKPANLLAAIEGMVGKRAIFADNDTNGQRDPDKVCYTFNAVYPIADEYLKMPYSDTKKMSMKMDDITDGYTACINTWGTKWDVLDSAKGDLDDAIKTLKSILGTEKSEDITSVKFFLETAWSPAYGFNEVLSKKNPNISIIIYSEEGGCGLYQETTYRAGEVIKEDNWDSETEKNLYYGESIESVIETLVDNRSYEIEEGEDFFETAKGILDELKDCLHLIKEEDVKRVPGIVSNAIRKVKENIKIN